MNRLRPNPSLRHDIVQAVSRLKREGLLDGTGGALSMLGSTGISITAGGSARRFWRVGHRDVLEMNASGHLLKEAESRRRLPLGAGTHAMLYSLWPAARVVIHSHAGYAFLASAFGLSLTGEPPVRPMGQVPCLGTGLNRSIVTREDWDYQILPGQLRSFFESAATENRKASISFLEFEHGSYVVGTKLSTAITDLALLESGARVAVLRAQLNGNV